jgi:hypothetical protein
MLGKKLLKEKSTTVSRSSVSTLYVFPSLAGMKSFVLRLEKVANGRNVRRVVLKSHSRPTRRMPITFVNKGRSVILRIGQRL